MARIRKSYRGLTAHVKEALDIVDDTEELQ